MLPAADAARQEARPGHLRMALVNLKCRTSDGPDARANAEAVAANVERHLYFIDRAAKQGAEFIGFPELSLNGYSFSKTMLWLRLDGPEVAAIAKKAREKGVYVSVGLAEEDKDGKRWNTQLVIGPDGKVIARHRKIWLTAEKGFTEKGSAHEVFSVKGLKVGICTCADGTDYHNLKALADNGARLIYGPHANTTGGTTAGWYAFRARWGGEWDGKYALSKTSNNGPEAKVPSGGWAGQLKVYAALHNHAAHYHPDFDPPPKAKGGGKAWASGAWFIGPDGKTLAQMPPSKDRADSKEHVLIHDVPLPARK
jgi:predicted amidohydrolase